jgi:hypothetical protein
MLALIDIGHLGHCHITSALMVQFLDKKQMSSMKSLQKSNIKQGNAIGKR